MLRFAGPMFLVMFLFWIYCIFDVISTDESVARNLPKTAWLFIVFFFPEVGGVAWLVLGRPQNASFSPGGVHERPAGRRNAQPMAPDDNPEFLRQLEERRLRRWEEELKQREADLRRKGQDGPSDGQPPPEAG